MIARVLPRVLPAMHQSVPHKQPSPPHTYAHPIRPSAPWHLRKGHGIPSAFLLRDQGLFQSCLWCVPILPPSCLPRSKSPHAPLTPSLSHTPLPPCPAPHSHGTCNCAIPSGGALGNACCNGQINGGEDASWGTEASVWASLPGMQVTCEQGPARHRAFTGKGLSLLV